MSMPEAEQIKSGPFTFVRRQRMSEYNAQEAHFVWEVTFTSLPQIERNKMIGLTYFCLKNYGGKPGPGFRGWKLVSGGPYDEAGSYATLEEAVVGVTPWLVAYYNRLAAQKVEEARQLIGVLEQVTAVTAETQV